MSIDDRCDRSIPGIVYLELSDGQSHKFYEVVVDGTEVAIRYGRIGTAGQSSSTTYATVEKAQAEASKKINEKLRKGYVQVSSAAEVSTVVEQPIDALGSVSTVSEVRSHRFDLARLRLGIYQDRIFLGVPLQEPLVAVEITAICNHPTFTINLDAGSDIAYHFDARSSEGRIVQNTCIAGTWGAGGEILSMPPEFVSSQPFTLKIAVEQELVVYLNDRVLTRYAHCIPPTQMNTVHIVYPPENLQVQSVQVFEYVNPDVNPEPALPPVPDQISTLSEQLLADPIQPPLSAIDPTIPDPSRDLLNVEHPLPRSLACIEILGTFHDLAHGGFTIRLTANQDRDTVYVYGLDFEPNQRQMMQWSEVAGVRQEKRLELPSAIASGQASQFLLMMTQEGYIRVHLVGSEFPSFYTALVSSDPPDTLHLTYDTSGFKLERLSVLEKPTSERKVFHSNSTDRPAFLEDLSSQFEPLRSFLEANLVPYIKFTVIDAGHLNSANFRGPADWSGDPLELWQSKIGGHPYLPKGTSYPTDAETGETMMFLMQINCADLPVIESLNLPRQGLLQFYVGLDVPMCALSPEQHRVLYYPNVSKDKNDLITDFSFLAEPARSLEWYDEVYTLSFSAQQDVFWTARQKLDESFEVPKHLIELCKEFEEEIIVAYEDEAMDGRWLINKLGGYPEPNSSLYELHEYEVIDRFRGHLLLEFQHPSDIDRNFYFFIEDSDLVNLNFSNVQSYFISV